MIFLINPVDKDDSESRIQLIGTDFRASGPGALDRESLTFTAVLIKIKLSSLLTLVECSLSCQRIYFQRLNY